MNHRARAGRNPGRTWPIYDSALLAGLVLDAIRERFGNSQRAAAKATRLSQALLSRLRNGTQHDIEPATLVKLHSLIARENEDALRRAILAPGATELGQGFSAWVQRSVHHAHVGLGSWWSLTPDGPLEDGVVKDDTGQTQRDLERSALWQYLREVAPATVNQAEALFAKDASYPQYRLVMLERILGPLLNYAESAFVEYSWRELRETRPRTLVKIVELGIRRERLLLRREDTLERNARAMRGTAVE